MHNALVILHVSISIKSVDIILTKVLIYLEYERSSMVTGAETVVCVQNVLKAKLLLFSVRVWTVPRSSCIIMKNGLLSFSTVKMRRSSEKSYVLAWLMMIPSKNNALNVCYVNSFCSRCAFVRLNGWKMSIVKFQTLFLRIKLIWKH